MKTEPLYRPFRVGEKVQSGMVVYYDNIDWDVGQEQEDDRDGEPDFLIVSDYTESRWIGSHVLHALALLRIDEDGTRKASQ